jgi:hypothetical protein
MAYNQSMQNYINHFEEYLKTIHLNDEKNGNTIFHDIEIFKTKYNMKFIEFWTKYNNKSNLLKAMYACSCKMTAMPFYMLRSTGPILVYSNYVKMEGIEIFKIYLKFFGYDLYNEHNNKNKDSLKYVEYHGDINQDIRTKNLKAFNNSYNKEGNIIKVILISAAGSEGINLLNVKQVHIMEPYWNEVRITQLIGRAIRMCSHKDLPIDQRNVIIYRYHAIRKNNITTTDEEIFKLANEKHNLIESFLHTVRESAVDCELFKNHNMVQNKYECFKFNEKSLFTKFIGPAYKDNIQFEKKINNGLNSINSVKKKIKVFKIKGVIKGNNSSSNDYWYNPDTGAVYDYDLDYPIGKVLFDNLIPHKIDKDTYLIEEIIPIPLLKKII